MTNFEFHLGPNEFYNHDNWLGLFTQDIEPVEFFSVEKEQVNLISDTYSIGLGAAYEGSNQNMPGAAITFELSNIKRTHERSAYTLMILLGDIGGF